MSKRNNFTPIILESWLQISVFPTPVGPAKRNLKDKLSGDIKIYDHKIPKGETSKSFTEYVKIVEKLATQKFDRCDQFCE